MRLFRFRIDRQTYKNVYHNKLKSKIYHTDEIKFPLKISTMPAFFQPFITI